MLLEPLLVEIFAFIGADDMSRTAAGSGGAWASLYARPIARVVDVWPSVERGVVPRRKLRHFSGGCSCLCIYVMPDRICDSWPAHQMGDPRWRRINKKQGGDADDRCGCFVAVPPLVTVPRAARAHARRVHANKSFTFINLRFHARQGALSVQGRRFGRRRPLGTYRMLPLFGSPGDAPREPVDGFIPEGDGAAGPAESSCRIVYVAGHRRLRGGLVAGRGPDRAAVLVYIKTGRWRRRRGSKSGAALSIS